MDNFKLSLEFAHVGINCLDEDEALGVAKLFSSLLDSEIKNGNSSIFVGKSIEVMKKNYLGKKGHLGIKTNDIDAAIEKFSKDGFEIDTDTIKTDSYGNKKSVYLKRQVGGFAVHLMLD